VVENFLPEIDCDAHNGVPIHSDFWPVFTTRICGRIIGKVLSSDTRKWVKIWAMSKKFSPDFFQECV
jgi:hypothetical protein